MAKKKRKTKNTEVIVVKIKRHIVDQEAGMRRAPGQVLRLTPEQIAQQNLQEGRDYTVVAGMPLTNRQMQNGDATTR